SINFRSCDWTATSTNPLARRSARSILGCRLAATASSTTTGSSMAADKRFMTTDDLMRLQTRFWMLTDGSSTGGVRPEPIRADLTLLRSTYGEQRECDDRLRLE